MNQTNPKPVKSKKSIRLEAILPFTIFAVIFYFYFVLFFDLNLKQAIETIGYQVGGTEVNIGSLKTSFWKANIEIKDIEVTDSEAPKQNALKIGEIRFGMLWDALLRAKFVIDEIAVEKIEMQSPRKFAGKVKPLSPPPDVNEDNSDKDSVDSANQKKNILESEGAKKALKFTSEKVNQVAKDTALSDAVFLLQNSGNIDSAQLQGNLPSKKMAEELEKELKEKQKNWEKKIASLPQGKEIQSLGDRLNKVKIKDFNNPDDLQKSLKEIDSIFKEADTKIKAIQSTSDEFNHDIQELEQNFKKLNDQANQDIESIKKRFNIPKIDAKSLTKSVLGPYINKYIVQFNKYKQLIDKYVPPKLKDKSGSDDSKVVAHPRSNGINYEFGTPKSYPMFWIKKISISSKAGASQYSGDVAGEVLNITSNQHIIDQSTTIDITGNFPSQNVLGFQTKWLIDARKEESQINYSFKVGSYPISSKKLVESNDLSLDLNSATGTLEIYGSLVALSNLNLKMNNDFTNTNYSVTSQNAIAQEILKGVFDSMKTTELDIQISGKLPDINTQITSSIGNSLQKGFEKQISAKLEQAQKQIDAYVNEQVGGKRKEIETQFANLKNQFDSEIKKLNDNVNAQKQVAEGKAQQAKKDVDNQAKNKLEQEGKKALEDLKKKMGF